MTTTQVELGAPSSDDGVEAEIFSCLNPDTPRSFFLYAGAGSGKTRSLKNALEGIRAKHGDSFRRMGKKIAVITYTNAAVKEISSRVGEDSLFPISTIHSFCWSHIGAYHTDIQAWLLTNLPAELAELRAKQESGRSGSKAALDRERGIAATIKRIERLRVPRRFTYNPNGDNFGSDTLSHSEVLKITADFIVSKPSMQAVLVNKFPFLLIDESQDTNKVLIDAFFVLAEANKGHFALGLFGDTMQRIFPDGRSDLGRSIPPDWSRPAKRMNHRSPQRVVQLGNSIRAAVDSQRQMARNDSALGTVRLFIADVRVVDKPEKEKLAMKRMAELTQDNGWLSKQEVKTLALEHHMSASRGGFLPMFEALDKDSRLSTGLRKGELAGLRLFTERVAPVLAASQRGDNFAVMELIRKDSPLLERSVLMKTGNTDDPLWHARSAVDALSKLDVENPTTRFLDVLECVAASGLFEIPTALRPFVPEVGEKEEVTADPAIERPGIKAAAEEEEEEPEASPASLQAWRAFLETPFNQIGPFIEYVGDGGPYGTHQGVKGREFERVFVILDDSDARGFSFSYEKLMGAKPMSPEDRKKSTAGEEIGMDRTRRLLYVTCTRAEKSLALIAYTEAPDALAEAVMKQGWFSGEEIERV